MKDFFEYFERATYSGPRCGPEREQPIAKRGSVTYLKKDWKRISSNAASLIDKKNEILEGAFIITPEKWVEIEAARIEQYYDLSDDDRSVLVMGPLLLLEGCPVPM